MKASIAGAVLSCVVLLNGVTSHAAVFDLKTDWSDTLNPNGVWSYNEGANPLPHQTSWIYPWGLPYLQPAWASSEGSVPGLFLPCWFMAIESRPAIGNWNTGVVGEADWLAGDIITHSQDYANGPGMRPSNVTFTSPTEGVAAIQGSVWMPMDMGRQVDWSLYHNSELLTSGSVWSGDLHSRDNPLRRRPEINYRMSTCNTYADCRKIAGETSHMRIQFR